MYKDIDYYIQQANNMEYTDKSSRAGTKGYRFNDGVILLKYGIYRKDERVLELVNAAVNRGAQTPRYLAVKEEGETYWVLQEIAKGKNKIKNEDVGAYYMDLIKAPDEQYEKLLITMKELCNFGLEIRSENVFYDKDAGFTVIDIFSPSGTERAFDEKNPEDIIEIIARATTATSSLYYFSSWMGEKMLPQNQFENKYICYRILNTVKNVIPSFDIQTVNSEFYKKIWENRDIFEEFETQIKELDKITPETLEALINLMFEKNLEIKRRLRN